ncbi:hypothetical protein SYNPS1DRAFT_26649 [Syncephalis pseudoplumigaleata]|uniref:PXA domain-containing protein n=1 Tax=Syncephalis pseudoplumigaleata TaxID=1712513 RepID=A0A4P9Z544_9FUNG|nr:hypothetical protein SYNPS1DRAFT_26649 [Syncephalis pseudoplumigaleata]|eukprot:RKP27713.1 hypothetical protein SYNPS1DRAFT_26649 [Syncephalis pseudoplumigaleata]
MFARIARGSIAGWLCVALMLTHLLIAAASVHPENALAFHSSSSDDQPDKDAIASMEHTAVRVRRLYPRMMGPRQKYNQMVGRALEPARPPLVRLCLKALTKAKAKLVERLPSTLKDVMVEAFNMAKHDAVASKRGVRQKLKKLVKSVKDKKRRMRAKFAGESDATAATLAKRSNGAFVPIARRRIASPSMASSSSELPSTMRLNLYSILVAIIAKSTNLVLGRWQQEVTQSLAENVAEVVLYRIYLKLSWSPKMAAPNAAVAAGLDRGEEVTRLEKIRAAMKTGTAIPIELPQPADSENQQQQQPDSSERGDQANAPSSAPHPLMPTSGVRGRLRRIIEKALDKLLGWLYPETDAIIDGSIRASIEIIMQSVHFSAFDIVSAHLQSCGQMLQPSNIKESAMKLAGLRLNMFESSVENVRRWWNGHRDEAVDLAAAAALEEYRAGAPAEACSSASRTTGDILSRLDRRIIDYLKSPLDTIIVDVQKKARISIRRLVCLKLHRIIPVFTDLVEVVAN